MYIQLFFSPKYTKNRGFRERQISIVSYLVDPLGKSCAGLAFEASSDVSFYQYRHFHIQEPILVTVSRELGGQDG